MKFNGNSWGPGIKPANQNEYAYKSLRLSTRACNLAFGKYDQSDFLHMYVSEQLDRGQPQ